MKQCIIFNTYCIDKHFVTFKFINKSSLFLLQSTDNGDFQKY